MVIAKADGITFTVHLVKLSQVLRDFSASRVFQDLCHDVIGPDVRLYWDQAVYKKPEYPKPFPWHQDNGYTYIEPQAYLTCWVALNDATLDNGCPWVIPSGHCAALSRIACRSWASYAASKTVPRRSPFRSAPATSSYSRH